jgi:hypothetical protein
VFFLSFSRISIERPEGAAMPFVAC